MHSRCSLLLCAGLLALAAAASCGVSPSASDAGPSDDAGPVDTDGGPNDDGGPIAAQMNDVSILFPLASDGGAAGVDLLPASASGARGVLLPPSLYQAIGHITGSTFPNGVEPGAVGEAEYGDLYVVSLRIDPCFASLAPDPHGTGCLNQLRLVLQEVTRVDGADSPFDSALHLFYALTRAELEALVRSVIALRQASGGSAQLGALAPHPILAREGLGGPFASGLRALILQHAGAQNLTRATKLSGDGETFTWTFEGFDVSNASAAAISPMVIPTLPDSASSQAFERNFGPNQGMDGLFLPETTASDDLAPLANATSAAALSSAGRQSAFNALVGVENPTLFSSNTIDCGSCHLALPAEVLVATPLYGLTEAGDPNAFAADPRFVAAAELMPTLDPAAAFNVHAFSYAGDGSAGINQRTVNETAAIVAYLNTLP